MDPIKSEFERLAKLDNVKLPASELLKLAIENNAQSERDILIAKAAFVAGWKSRISHHDMQLENVLAEFLDGPFKQVYERS